MDRRLKIAGYIFLLGLVSYVWWKTTTYIKRQIEEEEREINNEGHKRP